jgi:hypothetical protein
MGDAVILAEAVHHIPNVPGIHILSRFIDAPV